MVGRGEQMAPDLSRNTGDRSQKTFGGCCCTKFKRNPRGYYKGKDESNGSPADGDLGFFPSPLSCSFSF